MNASISVLFFMHASLKVVCNSLIAIRGHLFGWALKNFGHPEGFCFPSFLNFFMFEFFVDFWQPPPSNWIKVNTYGSFCRSLHAGYDGVFRCSEISFLGAFLTRQKGASI